MNNIEISENGEMIIRNGNQVIRMNGNGIQCSNLNNMNINISSNVNYYQQSDQSYETENSEISSFSDNQDPHHYQQHYQHNNQYSYDDQDNNYSYEDQEYEETEQQVGLNYQQINQFPVRKVLKDQKDQSCSICLQEFAKNDQVRRLFCMHEFHKDCIDDWLLQKATCVVCQQNMLQYL